MKKGLVILLMLWIVLTCNIVFSAEIEPAVLNEINEQSTVSVIVMLKDEQTDSGKLSAFGSSDEKNNFENKKRMIKNQQDKVLSNLKIKSKDISEKRKDLVISSSENQADFELERRYSTVNGFSGTATREGIEKLEQDPNVKKVYINGKVHAFLDSSIPQINADNAWNIRINSTNITGRGETICVIDSGVDFNHTNLGDGWGNKIIGGYNAITNQECIENQSACFDDYDHGSHVAGIIISNHTTYKGVAPDANIVVIKALDSNGNGSDADVIDGIDWCVNNASSFNISVINMCFGDKGAYNSYCDGSSMESAISSAFEAGIIVTIAAGNCEGVECTDGIANPSCVQNATPVGGATAADAIQFQRGSILDLVAPSSTIYSTVSNDNWASMSGTSMSTPHVAAAAALIKQFVRLKNNTDISPTEIENILDSTGKEIDDTAGTGRNYSRIDVHAAVVSMDDTYPYYSLDADNISGDVLVNSTVSVSVQWQDYVELDTAMLYHNATSSYVLNSTCSLSGNTDWCNLTINTTGMEGKTVCWKQYANDSAGNLNNTMEPHCFNVTLSSAPSNQINITNCTELQEMNNNLSGNYVLLNDIDCSDTINWNSGEGFKPIGNNSPINYVFSGTLDGQGHKITGLYINRSSTDYVGLFGHITSTAEITNITLEGSNVNGGDFVGGLVGLSYGTISNSYSTSNITGLSTLGGLVGYNIEGKINDSYSISNVNGSEFIGGLVGVNFNGNISNSYSISTVNGSTFVGGLAGSNEGTINNSYSISNITGLSTTGGLVSYNTGTISNSYSTSDVMGLNYTGGLSGINYGTISHSYSNSNVNGLNYIGGLAGFTYALFSYPIISDSYSLSNVTGSNFVGGLVGHNFYSNISNSYYNYNTSFINEQNLISIGALYGSQFDEWLTNNKSLNIIDYLNKDGDYYEISNISDFKQLLAFGQNESLKFKLNNNLSLANENNFYIPYFAGEFDGNNKVISNLSIDLPFLSYLGLFGYASSTSNILNIGIRDANINGRSYIGGLIGLNTGTLSKSYSSISVVNGSEAVGGLAGYSSGTISDCYSQGNVYDGGENGQYHGGLIGYNYQSKINSSYSTCYVESAHSDSGGFVGGVTAGGNYFDENNFWNTETSGKATTIGNATGKTTAQMKSITTFNDTSTEGLDEPWDIALIQDYNNETWYIYDGTDYPRLGWEYDAQELVPTQPSLTSPANNSYVNSISMTWNKSDDINGDTVYYHVLVNGTEICYTTDLNCSYNPSDGFYQWNVTPYDGSGNGTTSESWFYTYDTANPLFLITSTNNTLNNTLIAMEGTAFDINNDLIYMNNTAWTWNNTYANWKFTNNTEIEDGNYHILITANDSAGNINSSLFNFTYDSTGPSYSNTGKNDSFVEVNDTVLFYASWSDSIAGNSHCIFSWNNSGTMENDTAQTLTLWSNITRKVNATNLSIVKWIIYANDSLGNFGSTGIHLLGVGNSIPIVIASEPFPYPIYDNSSWSITLNISDPNENDNLTLYTKFYINSSSQGNINTRMENNDDITFSISNSVFNKGDILIAEYWGGDGIHNSTKVNTTPVVVQNFIPAKPNIENPLNNSYTNTNVLINWTASTDDDSDTVNYYVMFNETQACLTHDINCSYLPPSEGYYRIYVVPNDGYENGTASDAIFVYYDTTKPIISSISSSSVTSSGATLRVTTNEDATCRYSRTNKLYSSMSDTFSTTGETSHSTVLTGLSSSVTYTYYIRCQDTAGNAMSSSNSTRFTTDSSGGGGGSSLNLNYEEKILGTITAGSTKSIDFFESYLYAITGFEVKAKERITNAKIKVEIGSLPSGASRPKGGIYKYLEITPSNIDDDEIDNVIIKFKVKKSWIQSKNYGSNAVKLHRYNDGKWTELDTERTGFGSDYYYYNAESPGFSIFAITGEKASSTPAGKATGTEEEDEEKNEKSNVEDDFDESEKDKESLIPKFNPPDLSWINWSRVIIGFGVIILFVFVQAKWNILRVKVGLEPESIIAMGGKIESANQLIKDGNIEEAKKLYKNTLKIYNALPKKEKKWVYKDINTLYKRIKEKENN